VAFVRENFIPLAVDARSREFQDSEAEFLRAADCVTKTAAGSAYVIAADAKNFGYCSLVPDGVSFRKSLEEKLNRWAALPEEARRPGAVAIPEKGPSDPRRLAQSPPAGALVVRVFSRHLGRDAAGTLRHSVPKDYSESIRTSAARFAEPANDFLWITEAEWKSLLPASPKSGQEAPMPQSLALRILRHHLDPARGLGESQNFTRAPAESGEFRVVVASVSANEVSLRIEGQARLFTDRGSGYQQGGPISYNPRLLGHIRFDPATKTLTQFEMVALGDVTGRPLNENNMGERPGAQPLGIAFEWLPRPAPADLVVPRGARDHADAYLGKR
jgi:hypothetical protein